MHAGFAPSTVLMAEKLTEYLDNNLDLIPSNITIDVITKANPDSESPGSDYSGNLPGRLNSKQVDLNRNWDCDWKSEAIWSNRYVSGGSVPFSEPETIALRDLIIVSNETTVAVVFWEAKDNPASVSPGGCGTPSNLSNTLAKLYGEAAGYDIEPFEAYVVTGDATNWLDSQGIASISVLLPSYTDLDTGVFNANLEAVKQILIHYDR